MNTNTITAIHDLTNYNAGTLNAWHIVALGAGAFVVHAYHTVVNAGGLKRLWSNFWNGPASGGNNPPSPPKL